MVVAQFELPSVFHPPPCLQMCLGHLFKQPPVQCELLYLMVVSIKLKKSCFSRNLVSPGGFLDSQTTDTQFFGFGDSQSMQGPNSLELLGDDFGLADNKSSDTSDSTETVTPCSAPTDTRFLPEKSETEAEGIEIEIERERQSTEFMSPIRYEDGRDSTSTNAAAWRNLDVAINGPDWKPSDRIWMNVPTIRRRYDRDILLGIWDSIQQQRCQAEADLMYRLRHDVHQLHRNGWTTPPANVVQGEFMCMAEFLSQIYPGMIRAASRSDLPRMQNLIDIGQHLLGALQVLVNVEKSAREDNNISMLE